jgi:hypothetical protein
VAKRVEVVRIGVEGLEGRLREDVVTAYRENKGGFSSPNEKAMRLALRSVRRRLEARGDYRRADELTRREDALELAGAGGLP